MQLLEKNKEVCTYTSLRYREILLQPSILETTFTPSSDFKSNKVLCPLVVEHASLPTDI